MKKCVITVVGKDTVGIIAKVCTYLAETGINILDISQTIIDDFFNMIMIVDVDGASKEFQEYTCLAFISSSFFFISEIVKMP